MTSLDINVDMGSVFVSNDIDFKLNIELMHVF